MGKKNKIKVLVFPSDRTGVSFFRSTKPNLHLEKMYPDEFHIDIDYEPNLDDDEWLKQYDIIHYHRTLCDYDKMSELNERLKKLGVISIMDIDDYWSPGKHHPAYNMIKNRKLDEKILNNIKHAEHITTTTDIFAKEISKFNKNVYVLPNSVDVNDKQFIPNPTKSDRIRIGWLGGSSHLKDIELLRGLVSKIKVAGLIDKVQFVLCGYDTRGYKLLRDPKTGVERKIKRAANETVWYQYEEIFTDNFSIISPEYKEFLHKFEKKEFVGVENEPYRRVWTKPVTSYGSNYDLFDISLVPLVKNTFNEMKSQLKVIEAGIHKKAIIAQDFGPYKIDLKNAYIKPKNKKSQPIFDETGNAFLVDSDKNHKDWFRFIKQLINEPEKIDILGENLNKMVLENYTLDKITDERRKLYKKLLGK